MSLGSAAPWESDPDAAATLPALVEVHAFLRVWLVAPVHWPAISPIVISWALVALLLDPFEAPVEGSGARLPQ